jgi:hypothetical protein
MDNITKLLEKYMFSNLANLVTAKPRHAENTDARLDIRRHDPEQEKDSKKDRDGEKPGTFDTYDNAVISIASLRLFLENFLQSLTTPAKNENIDLSAQDFQTDENTELSPRPVDAQASRAANIYQAGARTAPRVPVQVASPKEEPLLENEEVRKIHALLSDTAVLQARGVEFITIERAETFLDSLAAAVKKVLNT